ncbi:trehalose-6-phosphate synthase [Euzebya sp.]|uniref:alpha,alpha-trehalose-phosphate synthase (UDP-forming) n=1 Tax=Euzebya sp. TaxID=1971409 RepID=UPI003512721F
MATKLIVASNRGPVSWVQDDDGGWTPKRGAGGLIVALGGALQQRPGTWVSVALEEGDREMAAAHPDEAFEAETGQGTFTLRLVDAGDRYAAYYNEVANRLLWFTLHQLWAEPYEPAGRAWTEAWEDYQAVNDLVAEAVIAEAEGVDAEIHLQDYHLLTAAPTIRRALPDAKILLYVHTPWVHPTYFRRLPDVMVEGILEGLGACDLVGISAPEWAASLRDCMVELGGGVADFDRIRTTGTSTLVRDFVLGIDAAGLGQVARSDAAKAEREDLLARADGRTLLVRADRTDLSKNILRGLHAFERVLEDDPDLADQVHFHLLLNPSRQGVPEYREYLERCVAEADGIRERWGEACLELETTENFPRVVAALQSYDVLLTNPVLDGTNLVAKEGPALNDNDGVLVLSRTAGAATTMGDALLVNPFDVEQQADALRRALTMPEAERSRRALSLKAAAAQGSPADWLAAQRAALAEALRS